ncbi:hypothetical protein [Achromobacter arsenitoxydans]|uniref:Bacteriocin biosynthesis cyclodehydratase domain-containing protein n=1 Tax=Achromobacter arsenitoxydans SY8 TaxID=477184 RepID=H0F7I5_9BURK|nr:hypothetical protein [Achromobacter arsenitoxydans]EHK65726.1 hypothetical protein KYC_13663 [Achromobacter arsenitoxydans SY8]
MNDHSGALLLASSDWVNHPAWTLMEQQHDGQLLLVLTAGSDESYIVDEAAPDDVARQVLSAWQANRLAALLDDPRCGAAARQIQRAGALTPARAARPVTGYRIHWLGNPLPGLADVLQPQPDAAGGSENAIALIVRTNASWQEALAQYASLRPATPHLFVDAAFHHTVCIGPYVVPGQTACLACLGNRVAHRWGDLPMPASPAACRPELLAALLAPLLSTDQGLLPFVEYSVSLNLQTLASTRDKVFQLPWCPVCGSAAAASTGMLDIPWLAGR